MWIWPRQVWLNTCYSRLVAVWHALKVSSLFTFAIIQVSRPGSESTCMGVLDACPRNQSLSSQSVSTSVRLRSKRCRKFWEDSWLSRMRPKVKSRSLVKLSNSNRTWSANGSIHWSMSFQRRSARTLVWFSRECLGTKMTCPVPDSGNLSKIVLTNAGFAISKSMVWSSGTLSISQWNPYWAHSEVNKSTCSGQSLGSFTK